MLAQAKTRSGMMGDAAGYSQHEAALARNLWRMVPRWWNRAPFMRVIVAISVIFFGFAAVGEAHGADPIKDGGFESPSVPVGSLMRFTNGQAIGAWTVVGASGSVDLISTSYTYDGFTFNAKSGQQWLDLTGASQTATGVAQTFSTKSGSSYKLKFSVGSVYDTGGQVGTNSTVYVMNGSTLIYTAVANGKPGTTTQNWKTFSVTFKATSSKTTLSFINGDPPNDTDCGLDAVSVSPVKSDALLNGLVNR
jgi:hypothetical protein